MRMRIYNRPIATDGATMPNLTTSELRAVIEPFVGLRLRGDLSRAIDISCPALAVRHGNADVRDMNDDGVEVCRLGGFGEWLPWDKIGTVAVRNLDANGALTSWQEYKHIGVARAAA